MFKGLKVQEFKYFGLQLFDFLMIKQNSKVAGG